MRADAAGWLAGFLVIGVGAALWLARSLGLRTLGSAAAAQRGVDREVGLLEGIVREVVELDAGTGGPLRVAVALRAHRPAEQLSVDLAEGERGLFPGTGRVVEQRREAGPFEGNGRFEVPPIRERGEHVYELDDSVAHRSISRGARYAHDQRDAGRLLEERHLAPQSVLTQVKAVIGEEQHRGVLVESLAGESVEDDAHLGVDEAHAPVVRSDGAAYAIRCGLDGVEEIEVSAEASRDGRDPTIVFRGRRGERNRVGIVEVDVLARCYEGNVRSRETERQQKPLIRPREVAQDLRRETRALTVEHELLGTARVAQELRVEQAKGMRRREPLSAPGFDVRAGEVALLLQSNELGFRRWVGGESKPRRRGERLTGGGRIAGGDTAVAVGELAELEAVVGAKRLLCHVGVVEDLADAHGRCAGGVCELRQGQRLRGEPLVHAVAVPEDTRRVWPQSRQIRAARCVAARGLTVGAVEADPLSGEGVERRRAHDVVAEAAQCTRSGVFDHDDDDVHAGEIAVGGSTTGESGPRGQCSGHDTRGSRQEVPAIQALCYHARP